MLKNPAKVKNHGSLKEQRAQSTEHRIKRAKSTGHRAQGTGHRARSKTFPYMSPMSQKSHKSHGGARSRGKSKLASYSSDTATRWFFVLKKIYFSEMAGVERTGSPTVFSSKSLNSGPACTRNTPPSLSAI